MSPGLRKGMLAAHLTCSIGWLGAVLAYLVLDVTVATSADAQTVRAAWLSMGMVTASVIVPLAIASLITGLVMSLGTKWGLFRHWWVLISLVLTVIALLVLWSEAGLINGVAELVADPAVSDTRVLAIPGTLPHSIGGMLVLVVIQVLNVYKPQGLTSYGWRKQQMERRARPPSRAGPIDTNASSGDSPTGVVHYQRRPPAPDCQTEPPRGAAMRR